MFIVADVSNSHAKCCGDTRHGRNVIEQIDGEIPVRVDHPHTPSDRDVLQDEMAQQGRLARAGLAHDEDVLPAIVMSETKRRFAAP